jgi:hypothetical protein
MSMRIMILAALGAVGLLVAASSVVVGDYRLAGVGLVSAFGCFAGLRSVRQ